VKSVFSCCLASSLLLLGCTKLAKQSSSLVAKAYGVQIVEQSGGKQAAGVGAKLNDPVIVQVNGADGNAVVGALVTFHGEGMGFTPAQMLTDDSGQANTVAQLGTIPGNYVVIAETQKSDGGIVTVNLREIALGYQEKVGKQISEKYCIMCHDPESTPERVSNYDNLAPPQPHLFSDGSVLNAWTDSDLTRIIADGGPALGKSAQTPAYRTTLTPTEIRAVVAYIRAISDPPYQGTVASVNDRPSPK
jgi:mono/diheme cytochrome c family protein